MAPFKDQAVSIGEVVTEQDMKAYGGVEVEINSP
jgi:hypothetical protein